MKHLNRLLFLCFFSFLTYQAAGQTIVQGQMLTEYCPQYTSSGFSTRLPTFFRARISGLTIGETFYYTVRACSRADIGTTNSGVGGSLYTSLDSPTFYTGSPSFTTGNFDSFTVVSGLESYWFAFVNSTNIRFSAGNYVFPLVTIKSADPASSFSIKLALRDSIKVLAFTTSAGANNGTGVYGTSKAGSKDIVMLFDSNLSSSRPLTIALTENDNFAASLYSAPSFYTNNVDGVVGAWAGILPNTMPKGIRRIDRRDFSSNMLLHSSRDTNGVWFSVNTKNPAGGSTSPIVFTEEEAALLPTDFGFTQPFISVSEDADSFSVLVRRRYSSEDTASVEIELIGGTALVGQDFTFPSSNVKLTFAPGAARTDTFKFKIIDDALTEGSEVITLKLKNSVNGVRTRDSAQSITILDNDVPTLGFTTKTIITREGLGDAIGKIYIKNGTVLTTSVTARIKSKSPLTAVPGEFFLSKNMPNDTLVEFSNGLADDTFKMAGFIIDDAAIDAPDTIVIVLTNPSGTAVLSADSILTIIVRDNDAPAGARFIGNTATVNEKDGTFNVSVELLNRNNNPSDFSLQFIAPRSTAIEGQDFSYNPTAKIFSFGTTGSDTITVSIPVINDDLFEANETLVMAITGTINCQTFLPDTFRVTLVSDDKEKVSIFNAVAVNAADGKAVRLNNDLRVTGVTHAFNRRATGYEFTLLDATGGIQVFDFNSKPYYTFAEGDSITVSGSISQFRGVTQIGSLDTIIVHKRGAALFSPTSALKLTEATDQAYINLTNVRFTDISNWPINVLPVNGQAIVKGVNAVNDTLNIRFDAEGSADGSPLPELNKYYNILGIGSQNDESDPFLQDYLIQLSSIALVNSPSVNFNPNILSVSESSDSTGNIVVAFSNTGFQNVGFKVIDTRTGTATPTADYTFSPIDVLVNSSRTSFEFNLNLVDNGNIDGAKTIIVALRNPIFGVLLGQDSLMVITINDDESSIATLKKPDFEVYPNPTSDRLFFNTSKTITMAQVIDLNGRIVLKSTDLKNGLDISSLTPQLYSVLLWIDKQAYAISITKQ